MVRQGEEAHLCILAGRFAELSTKVRCLAVTVMRSLLRPLLMLGLASLSACLGAPPVHPRALEANELCSQYISQGNLAQAEVQCDLGLQFSPQYADLWVNKGLIAYSRGNMENAKEMYIKALRLNQESAQAYNNLGVIYMKDRAFGKAHDNFQRALKVNPDYTEARYNLALCYNEMKESAKSKKELRTIIAINPNLADPHATLGGILHEDGALEEAEGEMRAAVTLDPKFASAWLELGNILMDAGKPGDAKDAYANCIEVDPDNIECKNNAPIAQRKANLQDTALKDVKEEASGKNTPESYYNAARTYGEKGMLKEEEQYYRKCLKLDQKFALCHYGLYEIFKEAQRQKDALIACKNFLKFADASDYKDKVQQCESYVSSQTY